MVSSFRKDTQDIEKHICFDITGRSIGQFLWKDAQDIEKYICCDITGRSIPLEKIPKI